MNITVFGGSNPKPGQPAYQEAFLLGQLLGQAGHTVLTGGYIGTMEAVSRGAAEAGAHVIGVTCVEIEHWRPIIVNAWVTEERRCETLRERLYALMTGCDAAFALPGGPGTLAEIAFMWNHINVEAISARPLILIGPGWLATMDAFFNSLGDYVIEPDRRLLTFVPDVRSAVRQLS
jgi:uncharacterized protein (TIGR00725 family)